MVASDSFAEFLREALSPLGRIAMRRMFGKTGVFCDGLMLGMVTDNTLYFRVDDGNRTAFKEAESLPPLSYEKKGSSIDLSFWRAPERLFDESDELVAWADAALAAARAAIAAGAFRSDLFYRFNVFPIEVPPLRKRKEDIPMLVEYFVKRYAEKTGKQIRKIDKNTLELCQSYSWPGNIRELQNVVERAVILCEGDTLSVDESWFTYYPSQSASPTETFTENLADREREMIEAALRESRGRISGPFGAAAKLGIPRQTLDSKIAALGIDKSRFKA